MRVYTFWLTLCVIAPALFGIGGRAAAAEPSRTDPESGLQLQMAAAWEAAPADRYEWEYRRGVGMRFGVAFDYNEVQPVTGISYVRAYARRRLNSYLNLHRAEQIADRTVDVGGKVGYLVAFREASSQPKERGQLVFVARPKGVVVFALSCRMEDYPAAKKHVDAVLQKVEWTEPIGLNAETVTLITRGKAILPGGVPVPEHWRASRGGDERSFTGHMGSCSLMVDEAPNYQPSDAELVVRAAVERTRGQSLTQETYTAATVNGWPAYVARFRTGEDRDTQSAAAILAVVENRRLIRFDLTGPACHAPYLNTLLERITDSWRFEKSGPDPEMPSAYGALAWTRNVEGAFGVSYEAPVDWMTEAGPCRTGESPSGPRTHRSGIGTLVIGSEAATAPETADPSEAVIESILASLRKESGGRAKVVAREARTLPGMQPGNLVVFTLGVPDSGIVKGWLYLVPRDEDTLVVCLMGHEAFFPALRPVMQRVLDSLRPAAVR